MLLTSKRNGLLSIVLLYVTASVVSGHIPSTKQDDDLVQLGLEGLDRPSNRTLSEFRFHADGFNGTETLMENDSVYLYKKAKFHTNDYKTVLGMTWEFYDAQRSGPLPSKYRVKWRKSSHLKDKVVGGWYDAGDYLKLNVPLAYTVSMLSWGILEFEQGYKNSGELQNARESLRPAAQYLLDCHISKNRYIGQIGHPDIDHMYWGRAHQQKGKRPVFIYKKGMKAADLMGKVASALASSSLVFKSVDDKFADTLLKHAIQVYKIGKSSPGVYSAHFRSATDIYPSTNWEDDMAWAAAWLYKATGRNKYLREAVKYWKKRYWDMTIGWDNSGAATAVMLHTLKEQGVRVPSSSRIRKYVERKFLRSWIDSNGKYEIVKTPKGLSYPRWSKWGNLQLATSSAFAALVYSKYAECGSLKARAESWAKSQIDYALGSSGRSFVVGFGDSYPKRPHHAGASCPDEPKTCDWADFETRSPNPHTLRGALVGGPRGPGDNTYNDRRDDYITNEVSLNYNAAFAGALAALADM